jgi:hypothetical protein
LAPAFGDRTDGLIDYFKHPTHEERKEPKITALSALTRWPEEHISKLIERFWPAGSAKSEYDYTTVAGLARLKAVFDISARTGLDITSLLQLKDLGYLTVLNHDGKLDQKNWQTYVRLSNLALSALNAILGEASSAKVYVEATSYLNEQKRDALVGYAIWLLGNKGKEYSAIKTPSSLYEYLLIDVEMCGCDSTSYVAQAIASVQLYMQRCRLGLESAVGVTDLSKIPPKWWEWMSTYRIWEANRKIFLYPENYINPALRSDVTPQFKELTDFLLQTDISEKAVSDAYRSYFQDFDVVGNLVYCGCYSCKIPKPGTSVVYTQGQVALGGDNSIKLNEETASKVYNRYFGMTVEITEDPKKPATEPIHKIIAYSGEIGKNPYTATVDSNWKQKHHENWTYVIKGAEEVDTFYLIGRTNTHPAYILPQEVRERLRVVSMERDKAEYQHAFCDAGLCI